MTQMNGFINPATLHVVSNFHIAPCCHSVSTGLSGLSSYVNCGGGFGSGIVGVNSDSGR
jgi:hypothetical protein